LALTPGVEKDRLGLWVLAGNPLHGIHLLGETWVPAARLLTFNNILRKP
jgi:hypothetical protein